MNDAPSRGLSIRWKVVSVVVVLAVLPAVAIVLLLSRTTRGAVETLEQQQQDAALAEVSAAVIQRVRGYRDDADAVAQALALAAENPDAKDSGEDAVRAVLGTRPTLSAIRFEVPAANVSTVIREAESRVEVPKSSLTERRIADERGVAFTTTAAGTGVVVVPVFGTKTETAALDCLQAVFPDRKVVELPAFGLLGAGDAGGGAFHCITREEPVFDPNYSGPR